MYKWNILGSDSHKGVYFIQQLKLKSTYIFYIFKKITRIGKLVTGLQEVVR